MNPIFLRFASLPACFLALGVTVAMAQAPAPTPAADAPKPPVHKPEQSLLNRVKQDDRTKKQLDEVIEDLRKAAKSNEAAEKEIKRLNSKDAKENPDKVIDALKDKLDPAALKDLQEKAKELSNSEEGKKALEAVKKKAAENMKPKSSSATTTPPEKFGPSTFDQVPAPTPVSANVPQPKLPEANSVVYGDKFTLPPTHDPENPAKLLDPKDPRSRTTVVEGRAYVRTPTIALDADRIVCITNENSDGGPMGKPAPKTKKKAIDPVEVKQPAGEEEPFERLVATGRVNIVKMDNGEAVTGKGGSFIYDKKTGKAILSDWPQARKGDAMWVATRKDATIVIVPKGEPYAEGCKFVSVKDEKNNATPPSSPSAAPSQAKPAAPKAVPVQ